MAGQRGLEGESEAKSALSALLGIQGFGICLLVLTSGLLLAAPASAQLANSPWPMFHNNLSHTGLSPYDTSADNGTQEWGFTTGEVTTSPVIGSDGTIYIGDLNRVFYAINSEGAQKWNFVAGSGISSSPAIGSDGTVYVGSEDHNLYAFRPNGTEQWKFTTGNGIFSSPAIGSDGTIYIGSGDENLYAINSDGTQKWKFTTGSGVSSSPAVGSDGTIYVGSVDDNLYALNSDGTEKWKFTTGSVPNGQGVFSSPAIGSDGTIYVGAGDHNVYAINADGTEKWAFATGNQVLSSPAIGSDGTIYVVSLDANLYAINSDGSQKWAFAFENCGSLALRFSPAIGSDGTIYADDACAQIFYAINPDGTQKWQTAGLALTSLAIGSDGALDVAFADTVTSLGAAPIATPTPGGGRIQVNGTTKTSKVTIQASAPKISVSGIITIGNTGTGPLHGNVTSPKHNPPFTEFAGGGFTIAAGGTKTVEIVYTPTKKGSTSDEVEVTSDDPTIKKHKPIEVSIAGKAK